MKKLSVLISVLNYNDIFSTKNCINSLLLYSSNYSEIFIVDNNSTDNSYKDLKKNFLES